MKSAFLWIRAWWTGRLRESQSVPSNAPIQYSVLPGSGDAPFIILAKCEERWIEAGRVVAGIFLPMSRCYVFDITVVPEYRRRGIARELLSLALKHSQCKHLVPVSVARDACAFWARISSEEGSPIQLGMTNQDVMLIRYAHRPFALECSEQLPARPEGK